MGWLCMSFRMNILKEWRLRHNLTQVEAGVMFGLPTQTQKRKNRTSTTTCNTWQSWEAGVRTIPAHIRAVVENS
jgi:hypothetical protein